MKTVALPVAGLGCVAGLWLMSAGVFAGAFLLLACLAACVALAPSDQ